MEDPIEFLHSHKKCVVNQREIGSDAQSFNMALKAALRQDPDVILVGEMRDLETISTALTAAETGHLVFATLHTQSAPQTIDRIIDVFPTAQQSQVRMQLSVALQGVMTQQLLPTADGSSPRRRLRGARPDPGRAQPHPRGQDAPDPLRDADGGPTWACRRWTPRSRSSSAPARSPAPGGGARPRSRRSCAACSGPSRSAWRPSPMATYVFKAMDLSGAKATGQVEAESKQSVSDQLKSRGLIVLEIKDKAGSKELKLPFGGRIKSDDLTIMTRQLATMVSSGMTILRALYVLESQTENKALTEVLVGIRKDVEAGLPLSDAMERHPKVFNPLYVAMTRAGETGGILESSLVRVADQLEADAALRRQVKSAMVYPIVVLTFAFAVLTGLVVFIVPVFVGVFKQFGGDLPAITKLTVGLSHIMTTYWWALLAVAVGSASAFRRWKASRQGTPAVGPVPPAAADEGRRHRPEGRPGPLVADAERARDRRRADPPGPGDHGQDRRQHGRSRRRWPTSSRTSSAAARSRRPSRTRRSSPAWSSTCSAWARRPAPSSTC